MVAFKVEISEALSVPVDGTITQYQNNDNINGKQTSGGIASYNNGSLSECKNNDTVASITGTVGRIIGSGIGKTISKCENSSNIISSTGLNKNIRK